MTDVNIVREDDVKLVQIHTLDNGDWFMTSDNQLGFKINTQTTMALINCAIVGRNLIVPFPWHVEVKPVSKVEIKVQYATV